MDSFNRCSSNEASLAFVYRLDTELVQNAPSASLNPELWIFWLADWLSLVGWLAGCLTACLTTYMPASHLTSLWIASQTRWVLVVYGVKFWGLNRCYSKCLRSKNTLETCKNSRPTSGRSELPKSCTSTMNFHMVYFSRIPQNNASLKYPVSLVNQNVILTKISHWWLHMAQAKSMSLMSI